MAAVRARHVVAALVTDAVELGNAACVLDGGRGGEVELGVPTVGAGPRLGELDRVALAVHVHVPAINLVAVDVAGRDLGKVRGAAGGGDKEGSAGELLGIHGVL